MPGRRSEAGSGRRSGPGSGTGRSGPARHSRIVQGIVFITVVVAAGLLARGASLLPGLLGGLPLFEVDRVDVQGVRYLEAAEALEAMGVSSDASIWDEAGPWEERLRRHPLVLDVRIGRRLPSTLVVQVEERKPVALVATPTLEPVDGEGRFLPIDPGVHRLDLPLLDVPEPVFQPVAGTVPGTTEGSMERTMDGTGEAEDDPDGRDGRAARASLPVHLLAAEVMRLAEYDPSFLGMVSSLEWVHQNEVAARWGNPEVLIRFRPPLSARRLREAVAVLGHATATRPGQSVRAVDLRYEDQVVVRFGREP